MPAFNYENTFNGTAPSRMPANVYSGQGQDEPIEEVHEKWRKRASLYFNVEWHPSQTGTLYLVKDMAHIINKYGRISYDLQVRGDLTNPQNIVNYLSWYVTGIKLA